MQTDWSEVRQITDPEIAYDCFYEKFRSVYDRCFPYKTIKRARNGKKPWMTKKCLTEIRIKNNLYKRFLKNKTEHTLKEFKIQRNKVTSLLRYEKRRYMHNLFNEDVLKRSDLTWKRLNGILNHNSVHTEIINHLTLDGETTSDSALANAFNDYFLSIQGNAHDPAYASYLSVRTNESAFLSPTTANEIMNAFTSVKCSSCTDIDGLQIRPMKHVLDIISPLLEHVFNLLLCSGILLNHFR